MNLETGWPYNESDKTIELSLTSHLLRQISIQWEYNSTGAKILIVKGNQEVSLRGTALQGTW
jgi:hypothetical protein